MTLLIGATTPDAVILAGDSRTTVEYRNKATGQIIKTYEDTTFKVFELADRVCAATYGAADLCQRPIVEIAEEFRGQFPALAGAQPSEVAQAFEDFMEAKCNADPARKDLAPGKVFIGFLVGGWDVAAGHGIIYHMRLPSPRGAWKNEKIDTLKPAVLFVPPVVGLHRLVAGYDYSLRPGVLAAFKGPNREVLDRCRIDFRATTKDDAVALARALISVEILVQRSGRTAFQGVGGPIDVVSVTANGYKWESKKEGFPSLVSKAAGSNALSSNDIPRS